jgi:hypothetical protein
MPKSRLQVKSAQNLIVRLPVLIGNYLTTDQVLAVGGIQFQSEPLCERNHLVELRMLHHATVTMSR